MVSYTLISLLGLVIGVLLQMINMPLVFHLVLYIQKSLLLIARISEKEVFEQ